MCKDAINNGKGLVNGHLTFRVDITSGLVCVLLRSSLIDIQTNMLILRIEQDYNKGLINLSCMWIEISK